MTIYHNVWTCLLAVVISAFLEVWANVLLARSEGFRRLPFVAGALALVALAFTFLAYAVLELDLAVAYALWGGVGIVGTSVGGWLLFGQRLKPTAWLGMAVLICGMAILHLS